MTREELKEKVIKRCDASIAKNISVEGYRQFVKEFSHNNKPSYESSSFYAIEMIKLILADVVSDIFADTL